MRPIASSGVMPAVFLACLLGSGRAEAEWSFVEVRPGPTVWCRWANGSVTLDGEVDDWSVDDFQIVLDQAHLTGGNYANPPVVGGDMDCSGRVGMKWDGRFLYVAVRARDDSVAPIDPEKGYAAPWFHDGLMLNLHAHGGLERTGRYGKEHRSDPSQRHVQLGLSCYQPEFRPRKLPGQSRYVARRCEGGYELEAAIELATLGYRDPRPGDRLKMSLILIDRDPEAKGIDAFGQLIWQMGPAHGPGGPRDWADLRLLRDGWGADLVASVQGLAGAATLTLKGTIDVVVRDVAFAGIKITGQNGQLTRELKADRSMPKGRRLKIAADVDVSDLPEGTYAIHAATSGQSRGALTQFELRRHRVQTRPAEVVYVPNATRFGLTAARHRPPTLKTITRDTYLEFLKEHVSRAIPSRMGGPLKQPWRHAHGIGFLAAYLYYQTKEPMYADAAKLALESAIGWTKTQDKEGAVHTQTHWLMVDFMRKAGLLTEADEPRVREFLVTTARRSCWGHYGWKAQPWRRGAGHSALGPAVSRYYAAHRYPDLPEAELWRKYYELTWGDWWAHRDTIYNDTGYRALFLRDVLLTAYLTDREDLFKDAEAMEFWERLLHTTAPNGSFPHYGDTNGWSTAIGTYAFCFEYLATKTRDGRFRYAAHRIFDYMVNHSVDVHDYHMHQDNMVYGVAYAHLVADDAVKPKPPGRRSFLLTRKELITIDKSTHKEDFGHQIYNFLPGPRTVPDKIVFKSHDRDDALWVMIDVCGDAGHNAPAEPTNVAAMIDKESVLTCNQGYMDETPDLHNVMFAEDLEGTQLSQGDMEIDVPEFYDRQYASYARVQVKNYHGWPIDEERQFLFSRYRLLLMKDVVTFNDEWMCRLGPCWQTQQVGPEVGPNWANTYVEHLFLSGLGLGRGVHRWKNPAWDLLVFHPPKDDCSLEIVDRFDEQPYRTLPVRLRYVWRGVARKGEQKHWTTLLLPHAPVPKPSALVEKIRVLADTLKLTALHVATDKYYEDWLVLNDTGGSVKVGELKTDARQLHLWFHKSRGDVRRRHVLAEGGTFVKLRGEEIVRAREGERIDGAF